jgi:hypothetical protein
MNFTNQTRYHFLFLLLFIFQNSTTEAQFFNCSTSKKTVVAATGLATCAAMPVFYHVGRWMRFKCMSYQNRLNYAQTFYYKLSARYFDALNHTNLRDSDLQMIVGRGYQDLIKKPWVLKRFWRYFDYMSAYKVRQKFVGYPILYYEDTLKNDIQWLNYYINHLMKDAPVEYAKKKQAMRDLLGKLERLHKDIKASYTFLQEQRRQLSDMREQTICRVV